VSPVVHLLGEVGHHHGREQAQQRARAFAAQAGGRAQAGSGVAWRRPKDVPEDRPPSPPPPSAESSALPTTTPAWPAQRVEQRGGALRLLGIAPERADQQRQRRGHRRLRLRLGDAELLADRPMWPSCKREYSRP
jgi:hypothetical protein